MSNTSSQTTMANIASNTNSTVSQSTKIKVIRYLGILATLVITALFIYYYFTEADNTIYDTINLWYSPVVAFIAFVLLLVRAKTSPSGANSRKAYWGLALAVLFYFLGEITYVAQYFYFGDSQPYPYIADLFWAIGTVFFIDELFFIVRVIKVQFTKKQLTIIYTITSLSVVGIILFAFGDIISSGYDEFYTPFMKAMDLYYFTGDVLILFATIYVVFGLFSKTGFKLTLKHLSWIFLILGNFSMIVADTIYTYFSVKGTDLVIQFGSFFSLTYKYYSPDIYPVSYSIDNLLYVFQYALWALAFGFLPAFLNRSFSNDDEVDEEFEPVETKANMDFTVPSVTEIEQETPIMTAHSFTLGSNDVSDTEHSSDATPFSDQNSKPTPSTSGDQQVRHE